MLRIDPRASCVLTKHSTLEPNPQPYKSYLADKILCIVQIKNGKSVSHLIEMSDSDFRLQPFSVVGSYMSDVTLAHILHVRNNLSLIPQNPHTSRHVLSFIILVLLRRDRSH